MSNPTLTNHNSIFVIYLGGKHTQANIEVHDLVFTTGNCLEDCYDYCRSKWFGQGTPHIDGYFQIDTSNSTEIPSSNKSSNKLFCLNFGGELKGQLAEMHEFVLTLAPTKGTAISQAKKQLQLSFNDLHLDNCFEIDDIIDVSAEIELQVNLDTLEDRVKLANCYIKL